MRELKRSDRGRAQQADGSDSQQSPDGALAHAGQMRGFGMRRRAVGIAGLCLHWCSQSKDGVWFLDLHRPCPFAQTRSQKKRGSKRASNITSIMTLEFDAVIVKKTDSLQGRSLGFRLTPTRQDASIPLWNCPLHWKAFRLGSKLRYGIYGDRRRPIMALLEYGWWDQSNHCLHTKKVVRNKAWRGIHCR